MIGTHLKRGFLLTLLAVLAAFAPAALAQNGGGAVVPGPDTPAPGGNNLSPVTLSGGAVESPKLWTGEQQKFSVRVSVAEGVATANAIAAEAATRKIDMPICSAVNDLLHNDMPLDDIINNLLSRDLKVERE